MREIFINESQTFLPGNSYSKNEIYELINVPLEKRKGAWDTGYREYEGNIFIFSNVGIPGRTGHDYNNYWDGDEFVWEAKKTSHINQGMIQKMLTPVKNHQIHLFTRTEDRLPFTYEGAVKVKEYEDSTPVKIRWQFEVNPYNLPEENLSEAKEREAIYEGAAKKITVNKYERNPLARRICIEHHGTHCNVCSFDFYITYGGLGKGYIHVHHIIPLSALGENYILTPETDLIPVCPNCHSMIHKRNPPILTAELKDIIEKQKIK